MSAPAAALSKARVGAATTPTVTHTQRQELEYAFRLFDSRRKGSLTFLELKSLLSSIGISLTRNELSYLQMEEDIRGGFILEDLYALATSVYNDGVIRQRLAQSLQAHFPKQEKVSRKDLESLLYKLGRRLLVDPAEIDACLNVYCSGGNGDQISISNFIDMVLSE